MSAVMVIEHDEVVLTVGVCTICGKQHTNTLNNEPYDLCFSCEVWWLNQQGDTQ